MTIDLSVSTKCPECKKDVYNHCNEDNILSIGERYDYFDIDGFHLYVDFSYKCPFCGSSFKTRNRTWNAKDTIERWQLRQRSRGSISKEGGQK